MSRDSLSIHLVVFVAVLSVAASLLGVDLLEPIHNIVLLRLLLDPFLAALSAAVGVFWVLFLRIPHCALRFWVLDLDAAEDLLPDAVEDPRDDRRSQFLGVNFGLLDVFSAKD